MNRQTKASAYAAGVLLAGLALVPLAGQTRSPAVGEATYSPPRTPWGDPDLQGIWPSTHMVGVPFERPDQFGNRLYLTDAEFRTRQDEAAKQKALDVLDFDITKPPPEIVALGDVGNSTSPPPHWLERGEPSRQSSLIVEPANGKAPPMTAEGQARQKLAKTTYIQQTGFTRPDELGPYDRCISRGVVGSMIPVVYNNGNEIVQAPGYVVLRNEMIHESRIIPLDPFDKLRVDGERSRTVDGRAPLPSAFKSYMGSSRGRWDGNTLVVRTTDLNGRNGLQANGQLMLTSDALELVERFTPTSSNTLQYEVTITDPKTWTTPWKIAFPLRREPDYQLLEYACHEGNYSMRNTLSGSRADEGPGAQRSPPGGR
jgi:hypothetical protein